MDESPSRREEAADNANRLRLPPHHLLAVPLAGPVMNLILKTNCFLRPRLDRGGIAQDRGRDNIQRLSARSRDILDQNCHALLAGVASPRLIALL